MLIENFSQYPARRLEIQSALQFLLVHTWTINNKKRISFQIFRHLCLTDKNDYRSQQYTLHNVICDNHCFAEITICRQKVEDWSNLEVRSES